MKNLSMMMLFILMIGMLPVVEGQGKESSIAFKRNNITFTLSDVILKRLTFQYEKIIGDQGKLSVTLPFSYAFDDVAKIYKNMYYSEYAPVSVYRMIDVTEWYVGLGFNMYPAGQGMFRPYFGPEFRIGPAHQYPQVDIIYLEDKDNVYPSLDEVRKDFVQSSFLLNIGLVYVPSKEIVIGLNIGIGAHSSYEGQDIQPQIAPSFRFGLKL